MQQVGQQDRAPAPTPPVNQMLAAADKITSEQENIRWHERFIGDSPTAQIAVRRWRILIAIELGLLAQHAKDGGKLDKNKLTEWRASLTACTIGHIKLGVSNRSSQFYGTIEVVESRGGGDAENPGGSKLSETISEVLPDLSPGIEMGVREVRENIANAMECRFVTLHEELRSELFNVGELTRQFAPVDPAKRQALDRAGHSMGGEPR